jgi:hypothetical protein
VVGVVNALDYFTLFFIRNDRVSWSNFTSGVVTIERDYTFENDELYSVCSSVVYICKRE